MKATVIFETRCGCVRAESWDVSFVRPTIRVVLAGMHFPSFSMDTVPSPHFKTKSYDERVFKLYRQQENLFFYKECE